MAQCSRRGILIGSRTFNGDPRDAEAPGREEARKDLIAGHVPLQSDRPRGRHNTLVYFPDWRADEPLEPVARAMAAMRRRKVSLVLIVVLPEEALDSRRSDLEVRLRAVSSRFAGRLMVTVDQEGGWSHAFAVAGRPSAHLVNARRQFAWSSRGGK